MNGRTGGTSCSCRRWTARLTTLTAAAGVFVAPSGTASAATHSASFFKGELRTVTAEPCLGGRAVELVLKYTGSLRWTDVDDDGTIDQLKLDLRADVLMDPVEPLVPTYVGRLGAQLSQVTTDKTFAQTQVIHSSLRGDDHSQLGISLLTHVTSDENGVVKAAVERPRC